MSSGFSLLEYLSSLFFPYLYIIGYGVKINTFTALFTSFFGVSGLTFFIVFINLLFFSILFKKRSKKQVIWSAIILIIILIFSVPFSLQSKDYIEKELIDKKTNLNILVVQRNIDFWNPNFFEDLESLIINSKGSLGFSPDLIVWPESSVPIRLLEYPNIKKLIADLAKRLRSYIVFGTYGEGPYGGKYNQAMILSPEGKVLDIYSKIKVIPFFEGPPYKDMLRRDIYLFKDRNFIKGKTLKNFTIKGLNFGILICSEVLYPDMFRALKKKGIDGVIILSNEASLSEEVTSLLLKIAQFRAIEIGAFIIRANTTGMSAFISRNGIMDKVLPYGKKTTLKMSFPLSSTSFYTFYSRFGVAFIFFIFLFSFFLWVLHILRSNNKIE